MMAHNFLLNIQCCGLMVSQRLEPHNGPQGTFHLEWELNTKEALLSIFSPSVIVSNAFNVLNTIWCSHKCLRYFVWCKFMIVKKYLEHVAIQLIVQFFHLIICAQCIERIGTRVFFFFNFVTSRILRNFSENLAKLVEFTPGKRKIPKISQMFSDKWQNLLRKIKTLIGTGVFFFFLCDVTEVVIIQKYI